MRSTAEGIGGEVWHICESCRQHRGSHQVETDPAVEAFWICDSCVISREEAVEIRKSMADAAAETAMRSNVLDFRLFRLRRRHV